jgi:hypothetical protein
MGLTLEWPGLTVARPAFRRGPMMGHLPAMSEHEYRENKFFEENGWRARASC